MKRFHQKKELPPIEQQLILAYILKKSREYVLTHPELRLTPIQTEKYAEFAARRLKHEPMAYILGHKEFYGLDFKVTPDTLIPRPETELLVELVTQNMKREIKNSKHKKSSALRDVRYAIIDIGTGSGNIIISIAKNNEQRTKNNNLKIKYFATDISSNALRVARHNAKKHTVNNKIKFIKSNLLTYFLKNNLTIKQFNHLTIVANLPYLSNKIYSKAMPDVKKFEPKSALFAKKEGLYYYEKLFRQIKTILLFIDHCSLIIEISPEQKSKINTLLKKLFPNAIVNFQKDLSGKWRVVIINL